MQSRNVLSRNVFGMLAVCSLPLLAGCAGGGNGTTNKTPPTPASTSFAGNYAGTLTDAENSQQGTAQISITSSGVVTGTAHDVTTNEDATITGSISISGNAVFNVASPGTLTSEKGTLVLTGSHLTGGHLKGPLTEYNGKTKIGTVAVDLLSSGVLARTVI